MSARITFPLSVQLLEKLLELDPMDWIEDIGNFDSAAMTVDVTVCTTRLPDGTYRRTPTVTEHPRRVEWDWGES